MRDNDLTELDLQQGETRIQLRRNSSFVSVPSVSVASLPIPVQAVAPAPVSQSTETAVLPAEETNAQFIKSPMVGTFYAATSPNDPPLIQVGDSVSPEKTVCLIEAMKVYNEIQAECSGKVVAVLVKNGQTVEYGTPLFKLTVNS
jgi:acetyl-CoA carboxylase biotin carboxyl carrier protein